MDDHYCVPISIDQDREKGICGQVKNIIEGVRISQRLTRADMFILDFCEQRLLWASEKMMHISRNKFRRRECQNPLWALASNETFKKLTTIGQKLCEVVSNYSVQERNEHVCTMDFPVYSGNRELYITQKSSIALVDDNDAKVKCKDGFRVISINTVQMSVSDKMECTLIYPNGYISMYDMEKDVFLPPQNHIALTLREREVLMRAKSALTCEDLAQDMNISLNTLKKHRQSIYKKLNAHSFQQALVYAMKYNQI